MHFISVILPVYNGATTLSKMLESLLNQGYGHIELIVIADGSFDIFEQIFGQ